MRLNDTLTRFGSVLPYFLEVIESGALSLKRYPDKILFESGNQPLSMQAFKVLCQLSKSLADKIEIYSLGKLLLEGVKVFRPTRQQLEVLEQMALNVQFEDYVQPFQTMVVEFPSDYYSQKCVHCPQEGAYTYGKVVPSQHEPCYAIIRHEPEMGCVLVTIMFDSDLSIKTAIVPEPGHTIEEYLEGLGEQNKYQNTLEMTEEEWTITKECIYSALNYCLLLDEVGVKCKGPKDEKEWKRLRHFAERDTIASVEERKCARTRFMACPQFYELSQEVKLYRSVERSSELPNEPTGKVVPPHHRRGHYRMQACGTALSERKRIRIKPVFVNAHLFLGKMSDTKVVYS